MKFRFAFLFFLIAVLAAIYAQSDDESGSFVDATNDVDGNVSEVFADAVEEEQEALAITNEIPAVVEEEAVRVPKEEIVDVPVTPEPVKSAPVVVDPPVESVKKVDAPAKVETKTETPARAKKEASAKVSTPGQQSAISKFFASFFGFFAKFFGFLKKR